MGLPKPWAKAMGVSPFWESYFLKGGVISFLVSRIREEARLRKCFVVTVFVDLLSYFVLLFLLASRCTVGTF